MCEVMSTGKLWISEHRPGGEGTPGSGVSDPGLIQAQLLTTCGVWRMGIRRLPSGSHPNRLDENTPPGVRTDQMLGPQDLPFSSLHSQDHGFPYLLVCIHLNPSISLIASILTLLLHPLKMPFLLLLMRMACIYVINPICLL